MRMLETTIAGLVLVPLTKRHALELYQLVQQNHRHLTAHGDYEDLVAMPLEGLSTELAESTDGHLRFGIFLWGQLVGRIDLIAVDPPRYGLGYWLAQNATGRGYATAALKTLIEFASTELRASDIFAGVTHGNSRSAAVLERAGFMPVETFERYTRFRRILVDVQDPR